ncbi:xanthine dehydrogenase family protein molybdopterin-binding subunit [Streptomyces sp. NPDC102274]|uniref:xanthine dehydrogenase family protein molybdopterin-binding subunit n=1 Tax=Streptomyces sp. NPDC102274 TaxID=3366151 RepID=UPI0038058DEC
MKARGQAPFAAEFVLDAVAYASLVFSTIPKGRITVLDTAAAEGTAGVVLVMDHRNAPLMRPTPVVGSAPKASGGDDLPVMQDDLVHWNGQPVALVLAETQEQADHAASLVEVGYEVGQATTTLAQATANGTEPGEVFGMPLHVEIGDAEAALVAAPTSVDVTYRTPYQNHAAIEPHAATLEWRGGQLWVHDASQSVTHSAWSLAQVFGIDEQHVHVTSPFVGGGFGGKLLWRHQVLGAAAAKLVGRPVRIALTRGGVFRMVGGRPCTEQRVALGADAEGRLRAVVHTGTSVTTRYNVASEPFTLGTMSAYAAGSFLLDVQVAYQDMVANSTMRAPGGAVGTFALECAMDELAAELAMDPIALRILNEPDKDPVSGNAFSSRNIVQAWRAGADRFGWDRRHRVPGTVREGDWFVGMGCATASHPYVRQPGGAARITLTKDAHATVEVAAHDMGMGTATVQTQIIADRLALDPRQITFRFGDSALPGLVMAAGSHQNASIGAALVAAQRALVTELLDLVGDHPSPLTGLTAHQVGALDAGLAHLDESGRHESYAAILNRSGRDRITVEADAPPPAEMGGWSMHSLGAMFCEVRVHAATGETRIDRFLGSMDCGRVLNAKTAASQIRGGIIMGIGLALMEETHFDGRTGRVMNPSLAEYHIPVHMDVPEINVMFTDIPDPHAPVGARGIGELGITGTGAAIANAIYNATGKRVRDLPLTLDKML